MTLRISYLNFTCITCIFIKCCLILILWKYASAPRGLILIYIVVNKTGKGPVYIHQTNWMLDVAWEKSLDMAILRYCLLDKDLLVLFMDQFNLGSINDIWDIFTAILSFSWHEWTRSSLWPARTLYSSLLILWFPLSRKQPGYISPWLELSTFKCHLILKVFIFPC